MCVVTACVMFRVRSFVVDVAAQFLSSFPICGVYASTYEYVQTCEHTYLCYRSVKHVDYSQQMVEHALYF